MGALTLSSNALTSGDMLKPKITHLSCSKICHHLYQLHYKLDEMIYKHEVKQHVSVFFGCLQGDIQQRKMH